jgi:uncharacterized Zn-binding protein involved in type VI secretion
MSGLPTLRLGDFNLGRGVLFMGQLNVLTNNRPTSRLGDLCTPHPGHGKKIHPPNPLVTGSLTVLIGNRPAGKVTKVEALLHPYVSGSTNVLIGG